jgi:predicted phosphodiesterase
MKKWWIAGTVILGLGLVAAGLIWFWPRSAGLIIPQVEVKEKPFKIAVMADIHSDWEHFKKGLETAKNDGVALVIVNGDLTTAGKKEELLAGKKMLDASGLPYYLVSGNHDVYLSQKTKKDLISEVFGPATTSFEQDTFLFILIPQAELPGKEIERCRQVTCLVFVHEPPYHPTSDHVMTPARSLRLLKMLKENEAKIIFAGHLHYQMEDEFNGLKTIISGALGTDRNPQVPRFLEYTPLTQELKTIILN